jgi:predicted permease
LQGRNFVDEESVWGGRPAAILTHALWVRRFGADPEMVGQSIVLNDEPTEVVGVLPAWFDFASTFTPATQVDFLLPFPISDETDQWGNTMAMIGRLRPGVTATGAQADFDRVTAQLEDADPARWGLGAVITPLRDQIAGDFKAPLLLLVAAACVVLLVACANLSNLLLARGRTRSREMAVRSALGANRLRLLRQLSIESLLLALLGGVVGIALAYGVTRTIASTQAVRIPMLNAVSVDASALLFTLAVTMFAGLLIGLAPVFQVLAGGEAAVIRDASRGSTEGRRAAAVREVLVVAEIALACVLLVGGGLLLRSFVSVLDVELGFRAAEAVAWRVDSNRSFESQTARAAFYDALMTRIESVPGVSAVGMTDTPPLGRNRGWGIAAKGVVYEEGDWPGVFPRIVDHRYLNVMEIPLLAGRHFTAFDNAQSGNVVILNQTAASRLWPGQDAVGQTALINGAEWQVVGVVGDVRHQSLEKESGLEMYLPYTQVPDYNTVTMVVRSSLPVRALAAGVRGAIREFDATMPTTDFHTLESVIDRAVSPRRFVLMVLGGFAATALILAAIGIYAVLSYTVSQRIPEIGIRMALGESSAKVRGRVVGRTMLLAGAGVLIGALASFGVSRLIASMLYGVQATDALTFAGMAAILMTVAALAAFVPARRASNTDPIQALRST